MNCFPDVPLTAPPHALYSNSSATLRVMNVEVKMESQSKVSIFKSFTSKIVFYLTFFNGLLLDLNYILLVKALGVTCLRNWIVLLQIYKDDCGNTRLTPS